MANRILAAGVMQQTGTQWKQQCSAYGWLQCQRPGIILYYGCTAPNNWGKLMKATKESKIKRLSKSK
jgi:hypothetical protein